MHKNKSGFRSVLYSHTENNIFMAFWDISQDFDIQNKVHYITLDNYFNNKRVIDLLE